MKQNLLYIITLFFLFNNCTKNENIIYNNILEDIDGNLYHTIKIGKQVWMVENLRVTHYQNGDPIPNINDSLQFQKLTSGAYSNYNNDSLTTIYGKLYNWYSVNDKRNICPKGWHIPDVDEWEVLSKYLGGMDIAGGKLKESSTIHWLDPNNEATNESGFTGLPGGSMQAPSGDPGIYFIGRFGNWWSATEDFLFQCCAYSRYLENSNGILFENSDGKTAGLSIRCTKD